MCLGMFLNDASLPYQYLGDSQAENYEKYKHIASLENTLKTKDVELEHLENALKTKDEELEQLRNILKTKDGHLERLQKFNSSLIHCGLVAQSSFPQGSQSSFPQGSQFVCGPHRPQGIARTIPPLFVPKAFTPSAPKAFQHMSGRAAPY